MSLRGLLERVAAGAVSFPLSSRVLGRLSEMKPPAAVLRPLLRGYVRLYGVDLEEAADPLDAFTTFNAFFTRRLKPGARPLPAVLRR